MELKKEYYEKSVKPVLEALTFQLVCEKPDNPENYMIEWLQKTGGYTSNGLTYDEKRELEQLRIDIGVYRDREETEKKNGGFQEIEEEPSSEEEHSEEEMDMKKINEAKAKAQGKAKRIGVSSEAEGKFNQKEKFTPKIVIKTQDQKNRIRSKLIQSILFNALDNEEIDIIINAMEERIFEPKKYVIKEGEEGDCLYIIESGELDCYKVINGENKHLKVYIPGEAFGELALLYNAKRAATIIAKTNCILWSLDRETFNYIVKDSNVKKIEKYQKFLKSVKIFNELDQKELSSIADALKICYYSKNDYVIKEGEYGDTFYIVEEGNAVATKVLEPGNKPIAVKEYKPGDYFGELALIKNQPRAANVVASTDVKLVTLERNTFKRILGPIEDILKRNSNNYTNYLK